MAKTEPKTQPKTDADAATNDAATDVELVRMTRSADDYPEPHEADVHPDEVDNYAVAGWVVAG